MIDGLNGIGYKDLELHRGFMTKITDMLENPHRNLLYPDGNLVANDLSQKKNYESYRRVVRNFLESQEFNEFMTDAIEFKNSDRGNENLVNPESLEAHIQKLINAVNDTKEYQEHLADSVYNIRDHYFRLKKAVGDNKKLIQRNKKEIEYDLLELEEALVEACLIDPRETYTEELQEMRFKRAMHIFEDIIMIFHPQLFSPTHERFAKAISESEPPVRKWTTEEPTNEMLKSGIGRCLNSMVDTCYSRIKDINKQDYENEKFANAVQKEFGETDKIMTHACYTKIWQETHKWMKEILEKYIEPNIQDVIPIEMMYLFSAYGRMGFSLSKIFDKMVSKMTQNYDWIQKLSEEDLYNGLFTLGMSSYAPNSLKIVASKMADELYKRCIDTTKTLHFSKEFTFRALWGLCNFGLYEHKLTDFLIGEINLMPIDRSDQDLFPDEQRILFDIGLALKTEGKDKTKTKLAEHMDVTAWYEMNENNLHDPCKDTLIKGIIEGLGDGNTQISLVKDRTHYEKLSFVNRYAAVPDLFIGFRGQKIGLMVENPNVCSIDAGEPNGAYRFRFRLNEFMNPTLKCGVIPIKQIIEFNPATLETEICKNAPTIPQILEKYAGAKVKIGLKKIRNVIEKYLNDISSYENIHKTQNELSFAFKLLKLTRKDRHLQISFNDPELKMLINNLKVELAKISLAFEKLSEFHKSKLNEYSKLIVNVENFPELLKLECDMLDESEKHLSKEQENLPKLNKNWIGQRLTINIPAMTGDLSKQKRAIGPEFIDPTFMLQGEYAHYKDWKDLLGKYYDNLNLCPIEPAHNYTFSENRTEYGIFPDPKKYRKIDLMHFPDSTHQNVMELEKNPMLYLAKKEIEKEMWKKEIPADVKMIANLLNVKQSLKLNYPYTEIMHKILSFEFNQNLINQHLATNKINKQKSLKFVPRNPGNFYTLK